MERDSLAIFPTDVSAASGRVSPVEWDFIRGFPLVLVVPIHEHDPHAWGQEDRFVASAVLTQLDEEVRPAIPRTV